MADIDTSGLDAMMRRVQNRRPQSPSRFQPNRSWRDHSGDRIERQMQAENHQLWGFVIYRTTYESQAD